MSPPARPIAPAARSRLPKSSAPNPGSIPGSAGFGAGQAEITGFA